MKKNPKRSNGIAAVLSAAVLAGSASLCLAASPIISQDFNSGITGWSINYSTGPASVSWNQTGGPDGSGCLQVTLTNGGAKVGPLGVMPSSYATANYWKYEFDMKIDPTSGTDGGGGYGNFQTVMRDAAWSWDGHWVGAVDTSYLNWKHMSVVIPSALVKTETMLGFELAAASGTYNADVIIYIDNLVITPMENPWVVHPYTNSTEIATGFSAWGGGVCLGVTSSLDTAVDAGGGFTPLGSLKLAVNYTNGNSSWQEGTFQYDLSFDPTRYSSFEFDLWVDSTNANGSSTFFLRPASGGWSSVGGIGVNSSYVGKWTHVKIPMGSVTVNNAIGFVIQNGGASLNMAPTTYWFDNLQFVKSYTAPTITKLANASPQGLKVTMDDNNAQWQRNGISTPADLPNILWAADLAYNGFSAPITYSFTLNDFPDPNLHRNFEAHMFFANLDSDPSGTGDAGNGAVDWNAADLLVVNLTAVTNNGGGYNFSLNWKTNLPAANPNHPVATVFSPTALGTWAISFTTPTTATMTGPGGISTNVVLDFDPLANFVPTTSIVQFGMFKNDGSNDGHNNQVSGTFSQVQKTGGMFTFNEPFAGPGLTNAYVWRPTSATAVSYVPGGVGKWLTWTLPADRFTVQVAPVLNGVWTDVTPLVTNSTSISRTAAIPATSVPSGPDAFFRLIQKN